MSNGVSTLAEDFALTTDRNGFLEEWYIDHQVGVLSI